MAAGGVKTAITSILLVAGLIVAGVYAAIRFDVRDRLFAFRPDESRVVSNTLVSVQELNRLTVFAASLNTIVTTQTNRPGPFERRETLIAPGTVRYEVDFRKIVRNSIGWDAGTKTLTIAVPQVIVSDPAMDPRRALRYRDGIVAPWSDTDERLDNRNWDVAYKSLVEQAKTDTYMLLARRAARVAIANNFEIPLRAAGIVAHVVVRFPDETT